MPPAFHPITPVQVPVPPKGRDWLVELKIDGFRGVVTVGNGHDAVYSKSGRRFSRFDPLVREIATELRGRVAVLDGEIACIDAQGRPDFAALMLRRQAPTFFAFDLLALDGKDLRHLPLLDRKRRLRRLIHDAGPVLHYVPHIRGRAADVFEAACRMDLEGVVCKPIDSPYAAGRVSPWRKVLNPAYTQKSDHRFELFERR